MSRKVMAAILAHREVVPLLSIARHEGYGQPQKHRKKIDLRRENDPPDRFPILLTFGWAKTVDGMA
jgi:hypothetical protein